MISFCILQLVRVLGNCYYIPSVPKIYIFTELETAYNSNEMVLGQKFISLVLIFEI